MRREAAVLAVVVLFAVSSFAGVAAAQSDRVTSGYGGQPNLDAFAPSPTVSPGERTQFTVQVANDGEVREGVPPSRGVVTTARNVRVEAEADDAPIRVASGEQSIGSVTENRPRNAAVELVVPEDVDPGSYELTVRLEYSYTDRVYRDSFLTSERSRTVTRQVTVVVEDDPRFIVRGVDTDAQVGGSGTATVELENVGNETASAVTLALESRSQRVAFEGSRRAVAAVDRVEPGETATLEYGVGFGADATRRPYPVDATVAFENPEGLSGTDGVPGLSVAPRAEQSVAVEGVESTLRVSGEGTVRVTVVNEGPTALENPVATLEPPSQNVDVLEPGVAFEDLAPGESAELTFDVEAADGARAGTRQFSLETEYEGPGGDVETVDPVRFRADVGQQRDTFGVETGNTTVTAGETSRVVVAVTNRREKAVTDISAKLFASNPLSAADDEAYVASLAPGETVSVSFRVSASGSAMTKDYPVSVDFQYVDDGGETRLSKSYRRPVTVVEPSGGLFGFLPPIGALVAVSLLVVPLAALTARRR